MQTTEPTGRPHRNHGLFSDHYLNVTLPGRPDWRALAGESRETMEEIRRVFDAYAPSQNEAQTEEDLVRPVLRLLGHEGTYEVQPALDTPEGTKRPDYVFYRDAASRDANKDRRLTDELLATSSFAVGDAKFWERPLDVSLKSKSRDAFSNKNPSYQIAFYMQHAGTEWGILTNGRLWRLYHKDTAHKLDRFYEVDLPALIEGGSSEDFLYFFAFFRRAAFEDDALGVRALLAESEDYARSVGDSLKSQVYEALRHLAQGFLDYPRNGLGKDPDTLREVYDNSLIVLYRLLFVLYAESRDLLPVRGSEMYREAYSLYAIKRDVAGGRPLLPTSSTLWPKLLELFGIINIGSEPLSVATFNGGLFDPERHPFLEQYAVGDGHLQQAVDRLARVDGQFVDYRDLAERHLGTIYEGLLEFHLEALPEPEEGWTVALLDNNGERHATGSYYTPDFVVKYIVEATVGPMLREAVAGARTDAEKVEAVLALNVLDPSMGSGHFLVEVTERIARFLVELGVPPEEVEAEAELAYWKRRVVQSCVYGVDLNPLAVDLAKLSLWLATVARDRPLSFLDHHLRTGNSLVGAHTDDLRPAEKKRKKKAANDEGQLSMLDDDAFRRTVSNAVGNIWLIEGSSADTVDDVKEQERLYGQLRDGLGRRYARLADLATATHFGVEVDRSLWTPLSDYATKGGIAAPPQFDAWLHAADEAARARRFFHWELEFPEVFFDGQGRPLRDGAGFDAVVGNPPYVRQESLGDLKPYLAGAYPETYHGVADLYVYFYGQGLRQLRRGGRMGYIVTNKWLRAGYGEPLRGFFATQGALEEIVDFGHAPIFPDADVFPCIVVIKKPEPTEPADAEVRVVEFPREALKENADLTGYIAAHAHNVPRKRFGKNAWSLETAAVDDLMAKIRENGVPLADYAGVKPYRGVLTGLNEAFLIDTATRDRLVREDPRCAEIIKPYLRGQDIKRWSPEWRGLWMIFTRRGIDIDAYPAVKHHLQQFRERLEPRPKDWRDGRWPGRKPGSYMWFEIQDAIDYWRSFEHPKIVYQEIQFHPRYSLDSTGMLMNAKVFFLPSADPWIIAVLNSPLMWWHNWRHLPHMKDEALSPVGVLMEKLPIAPPTDEVRQEAEESVRRLISLTTTERDARRDTLDWLRVEFGVEKPGQKLEAFAALDADAFVEEVHKRRPKGEGRLTPASLRDLRSGYNEGAAPAREARTEPARQERHLSDLVNQAYGLTDEEIAMLWSTAPPRMPRF